MLPDTDDIPVIRTDFSDQEAWEAVSAAITAPGETGGFTVHTEFVDGSVFRDLTPQQLLDLAESKSKSKSKSRYRPCLFIVDRTTLSVESNLVTDNMGAGEGVSAPTTGRHWPGEEAKLPRSVVGGAG